ncbi:NfeD family protein [Algoriphagus limi]|uniref:Nodulation protein NfeD n=1 Tax=Algoriphagus limi TaxID=2975273 RepID=A0ABT2G5M1_9BACT|nr:NfeD family protein [Algoriphagus limi]MCS5489756.1 nodulation protein NfeD [Algoriphagus limi]
MSVLILASLLGIGLILLLAEVLFIPGTTVVGIFGLVISLAGVAYAFLTFSSDVAWWITSGAVVLNLAAIIYGFRSGVWDKFSLKSSLKGGTYDDRIVNLQVGMMGKAISDIKPYGKAMFQDEIYEVKSESGFITVDSEVTIMRIDDNRVLVK